MPVVPATQEAELGGSFESREVKAAVSCDCTTALWPGDREALSEKKKRDRECHMQSHGQLSGNLDF